MEGRKLGAAELGTRLVAMREMAPEPITLVSIDPAADCETIGRITHMIERITPCQGGYCYYGLDK
jgi:hypothetical protein